MNPMIANLGKLKTEFESIQLQIDWEPLDLKYNQASIDKPDGEVTYDSPRSNVRSRYGVWNNDEIVVPM